MEEYLHNFKGIAKGRGLPPLNPMECGKLHLFCEKRCRGFHLFLALVAALVRASLTPVRTAADLTP
jgi:hypothetical protein